MRVGLAVIDETFAFINRLGIWMMNWTYTAYKESLATPRACAAYCRIRAGRNRREDNFHGSTPDFNKGFKMPVLQRGKFHIESLLQGLWLLMSFYTRQYAIWKTPGRG